MDAILEQVVNDYDMVDKLQIRHFEPDTKELLLEIVRFQRLLLDSCVNKRTFSSYDVSRIPTPVERSQAASQCMS